MAYDFSVAYVTTIFLLFIPHVHYRWAVALIHSTLAVRPRLMDQPLRELCGFPGRGNMTQ